MAYKESFLRGLLKEGIFALVIKGLEWLFFIGSPIVVGAMTIVAGVLQGTPIAYVIAAAAFAAASTVTLLLRFDEWRQRRTPEHKINYAAANVLFDYNRDDKNEISGIPKAQVAIALINTATFPLSFIVEEMYTSVNNRVNPHPTSPRKGLCQPTSHIQYRDSPIDMSTDVPKQHIEAHAKFTFRYGFPGREKYFVTKDLNITCAFTRGIGYLPESQIAVEVPQQ
jgi:hypothetical protein